MDTSRRLPPLEVWGKIVFLKCYYDQILNIHFFIFSCKYDLLNFNLLRSSEMYIYIFTFIFIEDDIIQDGGVIYS